MAREILVDGILAFIHPPVATSWPWVALHVLLVGAVVWALRAHPITIVASALLAPFTSLVWWMNIGIVALVVELAVRRPGRDAWEALTASTGIKDVLTNVWVRLILLFFLANFVGGLATYLATVPLG